MNEIKEGPKEKKSTSTAKKNLKKSSIAKPITLENESINGIPVVDYSHHYKSFYDIFVGQFLDPKSFDLQFVVRDTRNTYA